MFNYIVNADIINKEIAFEKRKIDGKQRKYTVEYRR